MGYKVGVIGHLGGNENFCDGQTVKTKNLVMLLERCEGVSVICADTYYFRRNSIKLLFDSLRCLLTCRHIFLLVSVKGMQFYLPFLYYLNQITKRHIYHYVVGSELLDMVKKNRRLVKYLNALDANWFEYDSGTRWLQSQGVQNVSTLTNFKMLTPVEQPVEYRDECGIYRFCTFSRVMEEKGITDAIEAISSINAEMNRTVAVLDIYGPIDEKYEKKLHDLMEQHQDCIAYRGVVDSQSCVDVLKNYYAMLFPTHWAGEGVPGTVIDAFASGLPVIASIQNANAEIICHGKQGILYPNDDMPELKNAVYWAIQHPEALARMRQESRKAYTRYMPETIFRVIHREMKKRDAAAS